MNNTATPQLIFESSEFTKRYDVEKDHEHGPNDTLVTYYREDNQNHKPCSNLDDAIAQANQFPQDEIRITVDEAESFERATGKELDSDVLPSPLFDALLAYVRDDVEEAGQQVAEIESSNVIAKDKVAGMRETLANYPSRAFAAVDDDGRGFFECAVYRPRPCGCRVTGNGTLPLPLTVEPCEAHR